ncbi:MAG TPA: hypothetical protein VKB51_08040 [bacterium]|nr:hypothetical protein [bacterium]
MPQAPSAQQTPGSITELPGALPPAPTEESPQTDAAQPAAIALGRQVWQESWDALHGQSIILGAGYTQGTLKFPKFRGAPGVDPQVTDNGRLTLLFRYETTERYFAKLPLQVGQVAFGYNFAGSYAMLQVDRQLVDNPFMGQNLGTSVHGNYLAGAPQLFVRIGPLYADRAVFWKFAVGLGAALVRLHGTVLPHNGQVAEPVEAVDSEGTRLAEYITVNWELQMERWLLAFQSHYLQGHAGQDFFTYEVYALSLGYTVRF